MGLVNGNTEELYDQTLTTAEKITDPAYADSLKSAQGWQAVATGLARLVIDLDSALLGGGDIPWGWVVGDAIEEKPDGNGHS